MRRTSVTLLLVTALALAATGCGTEERTGGSDESDTPPSATPSMDGGDPALDRYLDEHWPEGAGGTVLVARDGELVGCEGRGLADRAAETPASCDTVYDIGSVTKSFTAAAVMVLEGSGDIELHEPISTYLGLVPDDRNDRNDITVHHLLTHTAGLPEALGDDYDPLSREEMTAAALAAEPLASPGDEYHYSNVGYSLLAAIVEIASGRDYERFLSEALFEPAGMTHTGYVLPEWHPEQVAVEYDRHGTPHGRPYEHPWADDGPHWNLRGNGGLLSTAADMFRWYRALEGDDVLDQRAKDLMWEPHVPEPGQDTFYGYGWVIAEVSDRGTVNTHNGGNDWSLCRYAQLPDEGTMVFWASNSAYRDGEWNLDEQEPQFSLDLAGLASG